MKRFNVFALALLALLIAPAVPTAVSTVTVPTGPPTIQAAIDSICPGGANATATPPFTINIVPPGPCDRVLAHLASSELGFDMLAAMEALRQRWMAGESPEDLLAEIGVTPSDQDGFERWERRVPRAVPAPLRDVASGLAPGAFSEVIFGSTGALVVRLVERTEAVPPFEDVRVFVRSALMQDRMPETTLMDDLLEEHHYRQLVDETRLRWDDTGEHIVVLPEE